MNEITKRAKIISVNNLLKSCFVDTMPSQCIDKGPKILKVKNLQWGLDWSDSDLNNVDKNSKNKIPFTT